LVRRSRAWPPPARSRVMGIVGCAFPGRTFQRRSGMGTGTRGPSPRDNLVGAHRADVGSAGESHSISAVPSPHIGRIDPPLCLENPLSFFAPNLSPLVPTGGNSPGPTGLGASTPRPSNRCDFRLGCRPASQSPGSRPAGGTREPEAETVWPFAFAPFPFS
jgi:hypothetical protein